MQRTLLIFGCGYIGSAVAELAQANDWAITALTRNPETAGALANRGINVILGKLHSDDWHTQLGSSWDAVLNCVSSGGGGVAGYRQSYLEGMHSIRRWISIYGVNIGTFVYTSSTSLYTQSDGCLVDETADLVDLSSTAEILRDSEKEVLALPPPIRPYILRLAGIYGPGRHRLLDQLRAGNTVFKGSGRSLLNLIHRDDAAAAIMAVINAPLSASTGIYNVSDGNPANRIEITSWIAPELGLPSPQWVPEAPSSTPGLVPSGRLFRGGVDGPSRRISVEKIQREIGWVPRFTSYKLGYQSILGP